MKAREAGHGEAFGKMGEMLAAGRGVHQSYSAAAQWYAVAVKGRELQRCKQYGEMLEDGLGVEQSHGDSVDLYEKAIEKGYAWAQYRLAGCIGLGRGVVFDIIVATNWYQVAVDNEHVGAMTTLGVLLSHSVMDWELPTNFPRAASLLTRLV